MAGQFLAQARLRTHQQYPNSIMTRGQQRPFNLRFGVPVRAHRVDSYDGFHWGVPLGGLFYFHHFTALVVTALRAYAMRHFLFMAIRTLRGGVCGQKVMCAAARGACFRVPPFWIWHLAPFLLAPALGTARDLSYRSSFLRISSSADQRGSGMLVAQSQLSVFRFFPQCGQSPLQFARQTCFTGRASRICSFSTSSSNRPSP